MRERRRAQALASFALTLFDFARQRGTDGERLAQINRWEFDLERALSSEAAEQPIFRQLAAEERRRAFERPALERLFSAARRRATAERPGSAETAESDLRALGTALADVVLGAGEHPAAADLAAGLVGVRTLTLLPEDLRSGRCSLPESDYPSPVTPVDRARLTTAVNAAAARLSPWLLRGGRAAREVPLTFRRATAYLALAANRLLPRIEELGGRLADAPPHLTGRERLWLVVRARWGWHRGQG